MAHRLTAVPTLVYDGDCGFCTSAVRFIRRRIPSKAEIVAYQFADHDVLGTTAERAERELLWVENGRVYGGARAVARLLTDAGWPWRALGLVADLPPLRPPAQALYRLVAANRMRLPGGTPACAAPPADRPDTR
jgi:predicted DCC family thiol-disulfide oxidoreductase YuxK